METQLILGDCLDKLKELKDNSVDSIVTDPPYGLSFMGKKWDYDVPSTDIWEECIRVLKPGGHLLSFAGSRTYHRMAVRIEDAGFEIRDQIMWVYGSGFPKSHNIGKSIDKLEGNEREYLGEKLTGGIKRVRPDNSGEAHPYATGQRYVADTKGNSPYEGWGTALKPAHEPIVMARKPFKGTVADNVLEWGTGGINIDGCRVGVHVDDDIFAKHPHTKGGFGHGNASIYGDSKGSENYNPSQGRFPANIIFDEEAGKLLDEQSGISKLSGGLGYVGGASRFFYCPKTSNKDRNEGLELEAKIIKGRDEGHDKMAVVYKAIPTERQNIHPTVKPTDLMTYLIRLVTPKGGVVLDPFMGSGSTGKAAVREGMNFIGIEREEEYIEIAKQRIQSEIDNVGKPKKVSKSKETKVEVKEENKFWE